MRWCHSEPTIAELLSDPIVGALMAADRIAPEALEANLTRIAGTLEPQQRDVRRHRKAIRPHGPLTAACIYTPSKRRKKFASGGGSGPSSLRALRSR